MDMNTNTLVISLKQVDFHAFADIIKLLATKFRVGSITVQDSVIMGIPAEGNAVIVADMSARIPSLNMHFRINPEKAKYLSIAEGVNAHVHIFYDHERSLYEVKGSNFLVYLEAPSDFPLNRHAIQYQTLGVPVTEHNPKHLRAYVGSNQAGVQVKVFDDQIEQVLVAGTDSPLTLTPSMQDELATKQPDYTLQSRVAFKHIGKRNAIELIMSGDTHGIKVTTPKFDLNVDLIVLEFITSTE